MNTEANKLLKQLDADFDATAEMCTLSVAQQQMVEIAKAMSTNARIIILDEPTAALTRSESEKLYTLVDKLKADGVSIIFISHRFEDMYRLASRVTVFRDSQYIGTYDVDGITNADLIKAMVGREIKDLFPKPEVKLGDEMLRVENLSRTGYFKDVSFKVRAGEILGLTGLVGAGRTEIVETIFGMRKKTAGQIFLNGKEDNIKSPEDAIANSIGLLTEDRRGNGIFGLLDITENTVMASLKNYGFPQNHKKMETDAIKWNQAMRTKTPSMRQRIMNLSGGNQQKVLLARWLLLNPDILIVDEPTRGIDVGAKSEIHSIITQLAGEGKAIIMISSELPEVSGMADRILVMYEGHMMGIIDRNRDGGDPYDSQELLTYAHGEKNDFATAKYKKGETLIMEATKKGFDFKKFMSDNAMWFVLIILAVALPAVRPRFATVGNLTTLISSESVKGIITCGVCWCILSAGIDLGPGAVAALSAVVSASLAQQADLPTRLISVHMPAVVCIIVAMVIGAIVGIICGWLVACTHIHPFIATLGSQLICRALAKMYSNKPVSNLDQSFRNFAVYKVGGIPMVVFIFLIVFIISWFMMTQCRFGKNIFAIGGNRQAARVAGINVEKNLILTYMWCGLVSGLAGAMLAARTGSADPSTNGLQYEFDAIAAATIGGTSQTGGICRMSGVLSGILILGIINNGLVLLGVNDNLTQVIKGLIIVVSVVVDMRKNAVRP